MPTSAAPRFIWRELFGERALHLEHDVAGADTLGGAGGDAGARGAVGVVGERGGRAGAAFDHQLVSLARRGASPCRARPRHGAHARGAPSGRRFSYRRESLTAGAATHQSRSDGGEIAKRGPFVKDKGCDFLARRAESAPPALSSDVYPMLSLPPRSIPEPQGIIPILTRSHPVKFGRAAPAGGDSAR